MFDADETEFMPSGVINPYALVELIVGQQINWKAVPDSRKLLEDTLKTPYEELFDPKFDSPLYISLDLDPLNELERVRPALLDFETRNTGSLNALDIAALKQIGDLGKIFQGQDVLRLVIEHGEILEPGVLNLRIVQPRENRLYRQSSVISRSLIEIISADPMKNVEDDFMPAEATWTDIGRYFNEAAEFFDPIQGAVANCYLIAALSSVVWARPYMITHLTRATGLAERQFTNMIRFYDADKTSFEQVEVTDLIPIGSGSNRPIYCRSSEIGEIWPAIYEKAYAKWKTKHRGDRPDITHTAWGDCLQALVELTGLRGLNYPTVDCSADDLWGIVRANSRKGATIHPMVASTYPTGDAAREKIVYSDANLVASHCYSVLGWEYHDTHKYIILRNPWGRTEATLNVLDEHVLLYDVSWWRPITLTEPDGVFALEAETFKKYFRRLAVAK